MGCSYIAYTCVGLTQVEGYDRDMNIEQLLKLQLDRWQGDYKDSLFRIAFRAGNDERAYLMRPQATKAISEWLTKAVAEYEDKIGHIDMSDYDGGIPSPIQLK